MSTNNSTAVNVYLTFGGNCREAMTFYAQALDGQLEIMPFEGAPMEVPEDHKNKVMHATLTLASGANIMASDNMPGTEITHGNGCSISIGSDDVTQGETYFNNLAEGGTITMPYQETFWGAKFGSLTDKFGIQWMVNCELPKEN